MEYGGDIDIQKIVEWSKKTFGPVAEELGCDTLHLIDEKELSLNYYGPFYGEMYELFRFVAEYQPKYVSHQTECHDSEPQITVQRQFDEPKIVKYAGPVSLHDFDGLY